MNIREQGFLLLSSYLGDPERRPLTVPQLRKLAGLVRTMERPTQQRELTVEDLLSIGCDRNLARRTLQLLDQTELLKDYLYAGSRTGCYPLTRISDGYPGRLQAALGLDAPGVLWYKGDLSLLEKPRISLVGSRDLGIENAMFAQEIGKQAALQGYVLVSGNARGADKVAQDSCLYHGGCVISVVADRLDSQKNGKNLLYLSEEGFDLPFTAQRALQRNRIIHSLSDKTFVAQCTLGKGGTWSGTRDNLRHDRSQVFCFNDGSDAFRELTQMGAATVDKYDLTNLAEIQSASIRFL